jgi:hypothetical protein
MKIEIDLNDILGDEYGAETLQESVRRQVVANLTEAIKTGIQHRINQQTDAILNETLRDALKDKMPALLDDVMNAEYQPIDQYGRKTEKTSFRAQLIAAVAKECTYNPQVRYESDANAFTKSVRAIIADQMAAFKKEFDAQITDQFKRDAVSYAVAELSKRLGLTK